MKWLIIQSDGEHKGQDGWAPNWFLRECYAIAHAFQQNGHQASVWGLRHNNFTAPVNFQDYDALFIIENYEMGWLPDFRAIHGPLKVQWIIDAHVQPQSVYDPVAAGCDVILQSTQSYVTKFAASYPTKRHFWFPNAIDHRYFDPKLYSFIKRTADIIFIGGKSASRKDLIERLEREIQLKFGYGITGYEYIQAVLAAKIQFNKAVNNDINYRNFETIGLGACLLTNYDSDLITLGFEHDKNCLLYKTPDEAVALANYALTGAWRKIAAQGYHLSKQHTYTERIRQLLLAL